MNFFDTYEVSGTTTPPANPQPQPSLNEEVEQVVGQLSRFWGGFRKQSQTAFESARKDFGQVVQQAQKELTKLATDAPSPGTSAPEPSSSTTEKGAPLPGEESDAASSPSNPAATSSEKSAPDATAAGSSSSGSGSSAAPAPSMQALFSRIQSSLPPALVQTVQHAQLPESLRETLAQAQARAGEASAQLHLTPPDFAALRGAVAGELARVQGATGGVGARAEELLREAGEFLKDAVKVVPPEGGDAGYNGLIWDGTDVWMLPGTAAAQAAAAGGGADAPASGKGKGKEREASGSGRPSVDTLRAVATRAESMLKQLRHDPEVIRADPNDDGAVREMYSGWLTTEAASEDRGLGTTPWANKVERALADPVDGAALKTTRDALVQGTLTEDEFWTRYFFRVYQVEREEARRKAIIQGTTDNEEDFSWEDEDEEATSPTTKLPPAQPTSKDAATPPAATAPAGVTGHLTADTKSRGSTPGNQSPRQSSEESYDVVSSQASQADGADTATLKAKKSEEEESGDEEDDDDDDDEEEEDDDDDEDDDEEEDSDWE